MEKLIKLISLNEVSMSKYDYTVNGCMRVNMMLSIHSFGPRWGQVLQGHKPEFLGWGQNGTSVPIDPHVLICHSSGCNIVEGEVNRKLAGRM